MLGDLAQQLGAILESRAGDAAQHRRGRFRRQVRQSLDQRIQLNPASDWAREFRTRMRDLLGVGIGEEIEHQWDEIGTARGSRQASSRNGNDQDRWRATW